MTCLWREAGMAVLLSSCMVGCSSKESDALLYGAEHGDARIAEMAIAQGAPVNIRDPAGWTPLLHASARGHSGVVDVLLQKGASPHVQSAGGITPLMATSLDGHVVVAEALLNAGAGVDDVDRNGVTSLMAAASRGHKAVIRVLLAHGTRVNLQDRGGKTALMVAVQGAYLAALRASQTPERLVRMAHDDLVESARILLGAGADYRLRDREGKSSLAHARESGNSEMVDLMSRAINGKL